MQALSALELLAAWERGLAQRPVERATTLLAVASPDASAGALARLSVGQRDANLLALRERVFGPTMVSLVTCPGCGQRLDLTFTGADVRTYSEVEPAGEESITIGDYSVLFRLPNSLDLIAIADQDDPTRVRKTLLGLCVLEAHHGSDEVPADQLPVDVVDEIVERTSQADPQADVQLAITCPLCGHQWNGIFDIASFFWSEIDAWACRTLREVHTLASSYGWHERDILALSPWRRQLYLEMLGG